MANPYANYGATVRAADFIGRAQHVRAIHNRMFAYHDFAPVSIVGPPRVGKSSLARLVLDEFAVGRSQQGLTFLPVWLTVSGFDSEDSLFHDLAAEIQQWLDDEDPRSAALQPYYDAFTAAASWNEMCRRLKVYLRKVRRAGYQVVAVLDEFDAAGTIFTRAAPFEFLRSIAYEPVTRIALITTSRRRLAEIVVRSTPEISTFEQIFGQPEVLGCFSSQELADLIGRSPCADKELQSLLLGWLTQETGGQPFLSAALLSGLHERWAASQVPTSDAVDQEFAAAVIACGQLTVEQYETMLRSLREEGRLGKLLEVLFGPQETAGPADAQQMAREGIIKETESGWAAFSESFGQYLLLLEDTRASDDRRLWHRTETGLRAALASALEHAYGDTWQTRLAESQPKLARELDMRRERERAWAEPADDGTLLDFTNPRELREIIRLHWAQVEPTFRHSREAWLDRIDLLARVRNPMAHNRRSSPVLMDRFRIACQEVLEWLPSPAISS